MSYGECPNPRDDCSVRIREGRCYSDQDHIVARRFRTLGWLINKYIDTPENKQQICRREHMEKNADPDYEASLIPDERFMFGAVTRAVENGSIHFNNRDQERYEQLQEELWNDHDPQH